MRQSLGRARLRRPLEQTFRANFFFSCSKASCRMPAPSRLQHFDDQLIFATRFIDFEISSRNDRESILRPEPHVSRRSFEQART